ncbi:MAG: hypothetical protein AB7S26_19510 [Sandaracinaceae bacterium]
MSSWARWILATLAIVGCSEAHVEPTVHLRVDLEPVSTAELDLLILMDSSSGFVEEQVSFVREVPALMDALGEDADGDGRPDFTSVHVGVITADMGSGGFTVPTCENRDFGDDGRLRTLGNLTIEGCVESYPSFVDYAPSGGPAPAAVPQALECVARVGAGGCGWEQPLEAILKALSPGEPRGYTARGYVAPSFFMNATGHGDGANDGFLRDRSVLGIVLLTDEDDCSARDPDLYNLNSATYSADPNIRCFIHEPQALHTVERYVDGYAQLRRAPGRVAFVPIVGVPLDLAPSGTDRADFAPLTSDDPAVRDDRLEPRVDPASPDRLVTSCDEPDTGVALPPVRILRVAEGLAREGARVSVASVCQTDLGGTREVIVRRLREARAASSCVPVSLLRSADLRVPCDVHAVLQPGESCDSIEGASPHIVDGVAEQRDGGPVCVLDQLPSSATGPAPSGVGWYFDTISSEVIAECPRAPRRVAITASLPADAAVVFDCSTPLSSFHSPAGAALGDPCDPAELGGTCASVSVSGTSFVCDPVERTCGVGCGVDADCVRAGLFDFRCDPFVRGVCVAPEDE